MDELGSVTRQVSVYSMMEQVFGYGNLVKRD